MAAGAGFTTVSVVQLSLAHRSDTGLQTLLSLMPHVGTTSSPCRNCLADVSCTSAYHLAVNLITRSSNISKDIQQSISKDSSSNRHPRMVVHGLQLLQRDRFAIGKTLLGHGAMVLSRVGGSTGSTLSPSTGHLQSRISS